MQSHPIGIFDSGYGGLTVFKSIVAQLPQYDYIYLGDNARAPYGNRSFDTVHEYTLECVEWFFKMGCPLVILACNTASAKALRTIQKNDLQKFGDDKRVLGVIRPTAEVIGDYTQSRSVGVLGTIGTIQSESYKTEINKYYPDIHVYQQACPMWVHMIENGEHESESANLLVKKYLDELMSKSSDIDTVLLACTHYPILINTIKRHLPERITIVSQGDIVANSLSGYLKRHPELENKISRNGTIHFYTTDNSEDFNAHGSLFFGQPVESKKIDL